MSTIASFFKRYPLGIFFAIAYATSSIGGYLSEMYPSDVWAVFVYGPFVGAFIVTAVAGGRSGLREWLSRIVRWRVGWYWYAVALLLPVMLQLIAFGLNRLLGVPSPSTAQWMAWPDLIPEFVFIMLFIGLAEEPGFRGFALPRLLVGRSALVASLVLGVLHAIWHLPLFVNGSESLIIIPVIVGGSVLLTWLFLHTRGSVLLAMLMHSSVNVSQMYFGGLLPESSIDQQLALLAIVYVAAAVSLVGMTGTGLNRKPTMRPIKMVEA